MTDQLLLFGVNLPDGPTLCQKIKLVNLDDPYWFNQFSSISPQRLPPKTFFSAWLHENHYRILSNGFEKWFLFRRADAAYGIFLILLLKCCFVERASIDHNLSTRSPYANVISWLTPAATEQRKTSYKTPCFIVGNVLLFIRNAREKV